MRQPVAKPIAVKALRGQQRGERERGDEEAMILDEDYIRALSYGMPPAAGIGAMVGAIVLASVGEGKVSLIAGVTADHTTKVKAGELVNFVAQQIGGKGGGRPDMAQAGGPDGAQAEAAIAAVEAVLG